MKYKLYNEDNGITYPTVKHILKNRGIPLCHQLEWLNANLNSVNHWSALGRETVMNGIKVVQHALKNSVLIAVIVDSDVDGFTSAAIMGNYLKKVNSNANIVYLLHTGKQHGLADMMETIPEDAGLVICPDSASNDLPQIEELCRRGIQVLILDHHEADKISDNPYCTTINNQTCNYPNKDFSGAGIVWQFCRAFDECVGYNFANEFLDLAALGLLSDMMNYTSIETKAVVDEGLKHIHNPFFLGMREKNDFSIQKMGGVNYMSIAFYVTPFINATVRTGTQEEKEMVFKSFLEDEAFEKIESGKRGEKGKMVPLWQEAVRVATNVKAKQTKLQDSSMALLEQKIKDEDLLKNAIIVLTCEPGQVEKNIAGLAANKIQAKYQRPTLVLTRSKEADDKEYHWRGSARNYSHSEIEDMRQLCEDTNLIDYAQGHASAFGFSISENNLDKFIEFTNEQYKGVPEEPVYWVDYVWTEDSIDRDAVLTIADMKNCWGQDCTEPLIALKDIELTENNVSLLSADKNPTLKISLDGFTIMKFKSSQEEYEYWTGGNKLLTAVGKCNKNEWNGRVTPQIFIEEYEIREEWVF